MSTDDRLEPALPAEGPSPAERIVDLIESIKGHSLPPVLEARLVAALETALANSRKVGLICGLLEGFIRLVQFGADRGQIRQRGRRS